MKFGLGIGRWEGRAGVSRGMEVGFGLGFMEGYCKVDFLSILVAILVDK